MILDPAETLIQATLWDEMLEFTAELHFRVDAFNGRVLARYSNIEAPNLGEIQEEVATLRVEVHSLTRSHILAIPPVMPSFT